jgi:hypothetical protein
VRILPDLTLDPRDPVRDTVRNACSVPASTARMCGIVRNDAGDNALAIWWEGIDVDKTRRTATFLYAVPDREAAYCTVHERV